MNADEFETKLLELQIANPDLDVYSLTACGVKVICRTPNEAEMDRFNSEMQKEKGKQPLSAVKRIFGQTCLYPAADELAAIIKRKPGLPLTFGNAVLEQAGIVESALVEKA